MLIKDQSMSMAMFTPYHIVFHSISRYYTAWCEHTFLSTFMLNMSLETLNIILMCFDRKKQPSEKSTRESAVIVITKKCQ